MKKQLNIKKLILLNLPYILMGLFSTNFGEAWRMAVGADASAKMLSFFSTLPVALASWWPSLHPLDLLVGLCCGGGLRLAVYLKSKNAKKYRHGMEYGSARWGTHEDIAPYIDPVFQNNVILTKTESLTMNSRPKDPKTARNKNVLVIGGSGSGKTRFWLKPNLMQMHSSYVVTDPKGTILVECGKMLQRGAPKLGKDGKPMKDKHGKVIYEPYRIKVLNTINFKKSMHYNPFAYICSAKKPTMCMAAGSQSMCAVSLTSVPISGRFRSWKSWWPLSEAVRFLPVWCCRRRVSSRRSIRITQIPLSETWILPSSWAVKSRLPSKSWLPCWARKPSTPTTPERAVAGKLPTLSTIKNWGKS